MTNKNMKNEQILEKAIKKAIKNGWKKRFIFCDDWVPCEVEEPSKGILRTARDIIFSHDFAKAFWAGNAITGICKHGDYQEMKVWQYHLQQMVLEEEPLKYLEKFLK